MKMKEKQIAMGESVYLGLIILELSKILMHEMWYSYVKPKNGEKAHLCFILYTRTDDNCKGIAGYVELDLTL